MTGSPDTELDGIADVADMAGVEDTGDVVGASGEGNTVATGMEEDVAVGPGAISANFMGDSANGDIVSVASGFGITGSTGTGGREFAEVPADTTDGID